MKNAWPDASNATQRVHRHLAANLSPQWCRVRPTALLPLSKWRAAALNVSQRLVRATTSRHVGDPATLHNGIAQEHSTGEHVACRQRSSLTGAPCPACSAHGPGGAVRLSKGDVQATQICRHVILPMSAPGLEWRHWFLS